MYAPDAVRFSFFVPPSEDNCHASLRVRSLKADESLETVLCSRRADTRTHTQRLAVKVCAALEAVVHGMFDIIKCFFPLRSVQFRQVEVRRVDFIPPDRTVRYDWK